MNSPQPELVTEVRNDLIELAKTDVSQHESVERILFEMDRLEDPFDRNANLIHVTGSGIIAKPEKVVLHFHRHLNKWMQTGGHIEPGEGPWDAAIRESLEETGLKTHHPDAGRVLLGVDVHLASKSHTHLDLRYLLLTEQEEFSPGLGETDEVYWFSWEDAYEKVEQQILVNLQKARDLITNLIS